MNYLKNVQIAKLLKVSERSVSVWVTKAKEKKLALELVEKMGRTYVAHTEANLILLRSLATKGRKYKNKKILKSVEPQEEFYSIFNEEQIIDIITHLEIHKEIPEKYTYFNGAAKYWDAYVKVSLENLSRNFVTNNLELLRIDQNYISSLINANEKVNIIDIGAGNAYAVKSLLHELISKNVLRKYIALDYSEAMLSIAEANVKEWFKDKIDFEKGVIDISHDSFQDLLFKNSQYYGKNGAVRNIILFLGSTIETFRAEDQALYNIRKSIGKSDIFIVTRTLDTDKSKMFFDFYNDSKEYDINLNEWDTWFANLLNISRDYYEFESSYNEIEKSRQIKMVLKNDLDIVFRKGNFNKVVSLVKGDKILTWRHKHHTYKEIIDEMVDVGFDILYTSTSPDEIQLNVIGKVKSS